MANNGIRYDTKSYVKKAIEIHGSCYDYSLVEYQNSTRKIKIICTTHGMFEQRPCDHINQKQGCPKCSHNVPWTHKQFSQKSVELFDDKFKIVSEYCGMKHPITLSCKHHGEFTLKRAEKHLGGLGGCPACWYLLRLENLKPGNISKVEKNWLDSLSVPLRQHKLIINNQTIIVDGFDPHTNTVYECYGSFWHGNPTEYNAHDINVKVGKTFGELYEKTIQREQLIKDRHHLITKWV